MQLPYINPSNASMLAARSWQIRRERKAAALAAEPPPQPSQQPASPPVLEAIREASNPWNGSQLACTRAQVERIQRKLSEADEPLDCERLARSLAQLHELVRVLEGRPLPGSRRPVDDPKPRQIVKDIEPT
jgi:hypothetical protein